MLPLAHRTKKSISSRCQPINIHKKQQKSFEKAFKLTQRINQLSGSIIYQRSLSPWTRKRAQSIDRKNYTIQDSNANQQVVPDKIAQSNRSYINPSLNESKMGDFLRKIQFTKRKKYINPQKTFYDKKSNHNQDQLNLFMKRSFYNDKYQDLDSSSIQLQEIKQLIIYPRNQNQTLIQSPSSKRQQKKHRTTKYKEWSQKKINTSIQNFYDPYQNTPKKSSNSPLAKHRIGLQKFNNENNPFTHKADSLGKIELIKQDSLTAKVPRKNSLGQKSNKIYLDNHIRQNNNISGNSNKLSKNSIPRNINQSLLNQTFNSRQNIQNSNSINRNNINMSRLKNRTFTNKCMTQPCQKQFQRTLNPEYHFSTCDQNANHFQPTYVTPLTPAIKRLKQKFKKNLRIKTQSQVYKQQLPSKQKSLNKSGKNEFLYQTFAHYKSKKHSNDLNIKKTLKLNFFNQKSFKQNLQKVWLKPKQQI